MTTSGAFWGHFKKMNVFSMALLALYILLFIPFWKPMILGFILASACAPLLNRLRRHFHARRSTFAYIAVALSIVLLISLITIVSVQLYSFFFHLFDDPDAISKYAERLGTIRDQVVRWVESKGFLSGPRVRTQVDQAISLITVQGKTFAMETAKSFVTQAPEILLENFIFLLAFSAFLIAGPKTWSILAQIFSISETKRERFAKFEEICALSIGSILLTGVLQATLVVVGCTIAGVQGAFLIFFITFFASMVPVLGAGLIPSALAIFSLAEGNSNAAIILVVTALIAGSADNLLRAWLFSRAAQTNPLISLISLLGAISLMGFTGLVVAPVLEQLVMTYLLRRSPAAQVSAAEKPRPVGRLASAES